MKKLVLSTIAAGVLATSAAAAADLVTKAPMMAAPPSPWDLAFGGGVTSDYIFRGITQSDHKPSVTAYFEPRYNVNKDLQLYAGVSGESIDFPNRAAAEIDLYAGVRPTFDKLALDFGFWEYWYPGGQCFNGSLFPVFGTDCLANGFLPNGNVIKRDLSFWELYGKATYTVNDQFAFGGSLYYSPSVLNSGADGTYVEGNAKYTFPSTVQLPWGAGLYISGAVGHWFLGTSDQFYCTQGVIVPGSPPAFGCVPPYPNGIPYKSYTTWNVGFAFTKSVFTLDFRYYDTNLSRGDCNAFTSDHTAVFDGSFTAINPSGVGSGWCRASFVVTGKFDLTALTNLK
ncbi:MAG TPA: TorF family putative porin [Xanthobacteraceae bacterium]|jgi:uncharacterized protein (TIGR02001 family)